MISKWRIASVVSLCIISTLACGFSTWIWSDNNGATIDGIEVGVGDVTSNSSATIIYQKADLFTFGKYGFEHQEEVEINSHKQMISYFDYSYSITSLWKINASQTTNFKYEIDEQYNGSFNFLPDTGTIAITSYTKYDSSNNTLSDILSGSTIVKDRSTSGSIIYNLTLTQSSSFQYVQLVYSNTVTIDADKTFDSVVFTPATTQKDSHNNVKVVEFSFIMNKEGA